MIQHNQFSFLEELNPAQREAACSLEGPVMIVAGAGSGKTRVLTYRIAYLINSNVPPESILALTFTNKAAGEMKTRIAELLGPGSRAVWAGTFHSIFSRLFRTECHHLGYDRSFTIYDTEDSRSLIRSVMKAQDISTQEFHPGAIQSLISSAKNRMLDHRQFAAEADSVLLEKAAKVFEHYERQLRKNNALDFDDLLLKPLEVFSKRPAVLEKYQYRFRHILVDEYQDTNRVQYKLIRLLAARHRNVCVVGDDAQSIYSFRGADIRNMLDFETDYGNCRIHRLEQNYRSTGTILGAANSIIQHNQDQIQKKLWTDNPGGDPVVISRCTDELDEARQIVIAIEDGVRKGKRNLGDFCVLYRTNAQSRVIEDQLRRSGIPYSIVGSVAFYKRKEIKDVLAYLALIANPADEQSLLRILNVPARGIGEVTVSKLSEIAARGKITLFETLFSNQTEGLLRDGARRKLNAFSGMIRKYIKIKGEISVSELARSVVEETGILKLLKDENTPDSLTRRENIQELISALTEFTEHRPDARLEDFLEEVALVSDVDMADFGRNAVTLMTVHAAKGLEFPVVCIAGLEEGMFPIMGSLDSGKEIEEERRLMYVGMTRAREVLQLFYAGQRYRFGEASFMVRSRFLDEIDSSFTRVQSAPMRQNGAAMRTGSYSMAKRKTSVSSRQDFPDEEVFQDDKPEMDFEIQPRVGLRVTHSSFGQGRIVAIQGTGEEARAIVDFESVGRKKLLLKYAGLSAD